MRKIILTILLMMGCLCSSILFVMANETIEQEPIVSTEVPVETVQPMESEVPIEENKDENLIEELDESSEEYVMPSNPYMIESFVDEHGIEWNRLEESEQIFSSLKLLDLGISTQISVTGTRVAKYYSPKFGYLTKFDANDGMTYYCIDPYTLFVKGDGYVGSEIDFNKIPFETLLKIAKYISYGYMYGSFTSDDYFIATQLLIWEELGYNVTGITDMNGVPIDVSAQKNEIIATMETVKIQPSFDGQQLSCDFNKECSFEDSNHVLSKYYEIDENATSKNFSSGYPYIDNDRLYVKTDKLWELNKQVAVKSKTGGYHDSVKGMLLMTKPGSQDLLCGRLSDPILDAVVHVNLNTHDLHIDKKDEYGIAAQPGTTFQIAYDESFTHLIVPQCDMGVISEEDAYSGNYGTTCEVFNEDSQRFDTVDAGKVWTVGNNGRLDISDILPYNGYSTTLNTKAGHYWIREYSTTNPYQLNTHAYEIDLSNGSKSIDFVNLLRDVSLNVFKRDEDEQFRYLNGAKFELFEVVDRPINYEDSVVVGPSDYGNGDYPFDYPIIDTSISYEQLTQLIHPIEKGKIFIANNLLWKVISVSDEAIELGYLTNVTPSNELSFDMIPSGLVNGDTFVQHNKEYTYLGMVDNGVYVQFDEAILFIQKEFNLTYGDINHCEIGKECSVNNSRVIVNDVNDYQANISVLNKDTIMVDRNHPIFDLSALQQAYFDQYPLDDDKIIDSNKTIEFNHQIITIELANYENETLVSLSISYDVKSEHVLFNEWIKYDDISWEKSRFYDYTLLELIEPIYTFKSNEGTSKYHNQEIEVNINHTNPYLSFTEVESLYPWQTNPIDIGEKITKQYQEMVKPGITLADINALNPNDENQFELNGTTYTIVEMKKVMVEGKEIIQSITFFDANDPNNIMIVDEEHSIEPIYAFIDIEWECIDIKLPEIIARFDNADWKFFEQYPIHKNRIVHFVAALDETYDHNFIDADCDTNGTIDMNNERYEERTYTHPVMYCDIEFVLQLIEGEKFIVEKLGTLHEKESVNVNGTNVYVESIPVKQEYLTVIYSLSLNAPDYEVVLDNQMDDGNYNIDGKTYTVIDNLQEENVLSLQDEQGNQYRYYRKTLHKTSNEDIQNTDFAINTVIVPIENSWKLTYQLLDQQLKFQGLDIKGLQQNDQITIMINDNETNVTVIQNIINDGYESITLENEKGKIVTLNKVNASANAMVYKYFVPLNTPMNLSQYFNTDNTIDYVISTPFINKAYQATIDNNILTAHKVGIFDVVAVKQNSVMHLNYNLFKGLTSNESISVNGQNYTVNTIDEYKVEVKNEQGTLFMLYKQCPLSLDLLNEINKTVPLLKDSQFSYENRNYQVMDITITDGLIRECRVVNTQTNESYLINQEMDRKYGSSYQTVQTYQFVSTTQPLASIERKTLKPMMEGVTGNAYLRVVDPSRHNIPLANYPVFIYEDSEGLYPIKSAYSNQWGVVDVSDLDNGTYYWNIPNTVLLQAFDVKKDEGLLHVSNLKYSRNYMACEVSLPKGYEYSANQDVCIPITMDDDQGYENGIEVTDLQVMNKLRKLDAIVYKVDAEKPKTLLNGAVFRIDDIYEEGINVCEQYDCQGTAMPMVKSRTPLGYFMSGGIYVLEQDYVFKNPFTYDQLTEALKQQDVKIEPNQIVTIDNKQYKLITVWFKGSERETILLTDGSKEYTSSKNEKELISNYEYQPIANVAYQFADNPEFNHSMIAFTNAKGEIKFIPTIVDDNGNKKYQEGIWYYRKVNTVQEKVKIDPNTTTVSPDKWIKEVDENGNEVIYAMETSITSVYPSKQQMVSYGKIHLNDVLFGHELLMCETQSPFGYLRDDVCAVFKPEAEYTLTSVNHYRNNKRIIRRKKERKGYKVLIKRRLRYRQLGEFDTSSDCAFDWYTPNYLYDLVKEGK